MVRSSRKRADDDSQHTAGPQNTSERMQKAMDAFALPDTPQVNDRITSEVKEGCFHPVQPRGGNEAVVVEIEAVDVRAARRLYLCDQHVRP